MDDHIADPALQRAKAVERFDGVVALRGDRLGVDDLRVDIVRILQPLVDVVVEDVRLLDAAVDQADLGRIAPVPAQNRGGRIAEHPGVVVDFLAFAVRADDAFFDQSQTVRERFGAVRSGS
jgi:hypothetical protein